MISQDIWLTFNDNKNGVSDDQYGKKKTETI